MKKCRITKSLKIIEADINAYRQLSCFHYRQGRLGPFEKIFAIVDTAIRPTTRNQFLGVIVYAMAMPNLSLRNVATGGRYASLGDKRLAMQKVNRDIRSISRVIIEPRFRGLGVASWLVGETLEKVGSPIVESLAVMGQVNPFFERAGMKKYTAPLPGRCVRMAEAFSAVGIGEDWFIQPGQMADVISTLENCEREFVDNEMQRFMQAYGKSAKKLTGVDRLNYICARLSARPAYFIWRKSDADRD